MSYINRLVGFSDLDLRLFWCVFWSPMKICRKPLEWKSCGWEFACKKSDGFSILSVLKFLKEGNFQLLIAVSVLKKVHLGFSPIPTYWLMLPAHGIVCSDVNTNHQKYTEYGCSSIGEKSFVVADLWGPFYGSSFICRLTIMNNQWRDCLPSTFDPDESK